MGVKKGGDLGVIVVQVCGGGDLGVNVVWVYEPVFQILPNLSDLFTILYLCVPGLAWAI